jgi:hypothetical protein
MRTIATKLTGLVLAAASVALVVAETAPRLRLG